MAKSPPGDEKQRSQTLLSEILISIQEQWGYLSGLEASVGMSEGSVDRQQFRLITRNGYLYRFFHFALSSFFLLPAGRKW